jgi:hypothetical protein
VNLPRIRFTMRRMMATVMVMAVTVTAFIEAGRVSRWSYFALGQREARRMVDEVRGRRGTPLERPTDAALLADLVRIESAKSDGAAEYQPRPVGVACLGLILVGLASLLPLGVYRMARLLGARSRGCHPKGSFPQPS